jgi:DNA-binding transcriptional ArsR family regulator
MRPGIASADIAEGAVAVVGAEEDAETLDHVFSALADPVRRNILRRLDGEDLLVSELAKPFRISLQAVSRHIQVLVRAGLITQERTGRISRCRLDAGPIYQAAVWVNRYSKYWREEFNFMAVWLEEIDRERAVRSKKSKSSKSLRARSHKAKT